MGNKFDCVNLDLWCKNFALKWSPYKLAFFGNIGKQFEIFCFNHFALIAKEIALFFPVGGLFFYTFSTLAPCGVVQSSYGQR